VNIQSFDLSFLFPYTAEILSFLCWEDMTDRAGGLCGESGEGNIQNPKSQHSTSKEEFG
jgi:hypothetical protein